MTSQNIKDKNFYIVRINQHSSLRFCKQENFATGFKFDKILKFTFEKKQILFYLGARLIQWCMCVY